MDDYQRIARIIRYLDEHHIEQPDLAVLADKVGLSPFHFHRLFSRWAGVTPKAFLRCLTLSHARDMLRQGESVLGAALGAGLSGPGRLHDLCVTLDAASPGEFKTQGRDWTITAGFCETPFGHCLAGQGPRGLCHLSFVDSKDREAGEETIRYYWPKAFIQWDDTVTHAVTGLFRQPERNGDVLPLRAFVRGTSFQVRVWRALLQIPEGCLVSYGQVAGAIGMPRATRAVGTAVGKNPMSYLIPCHRVIRETGVIGNYRWGPERKRALIAWEGARSGEFQALG